jgi:GntR family transcriptional regulator
MVMDSPAAVPEEPTMTKPMTHPEIAADVQDRIERGEYPPGSAIPSYRKMAELYSVSESTAGKAIALLRERGLIEAWPGIGNIVRDDLPK